MGNKGFKSLRRAIRRGNAEVRLNSNHGGISIFRRTNSPNGSYRSNWVRYQ